MENSEIDEESHRVIAGVQELLDEVAEALPDLATTSEGSESDSGNSEENWGYFRKFGRGRQGIMWTGRGEEVPVTVGESDEDSSNVQENLFLLETSGSAEECDTDDRIQVSTDESITSSSASEHYVWDNGEIRYLDDLVEERIIGVEGGNDSLGDEGGNDEVLGERCNGDRRVNEDSYDHLVRHSLHGQFTGSLGLSAEDSFGVRNIVCNESLLCVDQGGLESVVVEGGLSRRIINNSPTGEDLSDCTEDEASNDMNQRYLLLTPEREGESIRIDRGGGTRSIVGEALNQDQQLVGDGNVVLDSSSGLDSSCERLETASRAKADVKDISSSSNELDHSKV